jgi:hypothetical protein
VATTDVANASPQPTQLVLFDQDPLINGEYDVCTASDKRGTLIPTLTGVFRQDFGYFAQDQVIKIADKDCMSATHVATLDTMYRSTSGEYYFTDGFNVWKVCFALPDGFKKWRNMLLAQQGIHLYSYEMALAVISGEVV